MVLILRLSSLAKIFFFFGLLSMPFHSFGQSDMPPLKLDQLVEEALKSNPEILAAKKKWEVYREKVPQAFALEDPMLGLGITNLPTNFSFREEDMTMKEISISQKLPFFGKRPLMKEMAEKEAEAVFNEIQERANRIIKEVKTAYYELSHVYRTTEVTQRNKEILEDFAKIAETRYSVGEGIQQDVLKAHVEVSKMVDDLIMLGQRKRALEAKLNALLDRPPETRRWANQKRLLSENFLTPLKNFRKWPWR